LRRSVIGGLLVALAVAFGVAGPVRAAREAASDWAAIGRPDAAAIADTLRRLNPQLVQALVAAFATLSEPDPTLAAAKERAAEIGARVGFTGAAVASLLRVLGKPPVPVASSWAGLIEAAQQFAMPT
jgi:hypothetical protein